MKKWSPVVAIVVLCMALLVGFACAGGEEEEAERVKEVKFGLGFPLSGIYGAALGIPAKKGLELANEFIGEFTVAGERYKWKLIFENNYWSSEGGVASATKLIFEDGVNIMAQGGGDPAMAAQTICEEAGVLLITTGTTLDAFGPDKPHTFPSGMSVYVHSTAFFKYISEAHPEVKTASIVFEDTATGHAFGEAAAMAAEYYGIEWLSPEYYPPGTVEFYPIATKMASKNPDLCSVSPSILQIMRDMGWEGIPFYSLWLPSYGETYGWETVEGLLIYVPAPFGEGLHEALKPLAAEYERRFGEEFGQLASGRVIVLYWLTDVLKKAGTVDDVDQIIATLETETFDTPMGPIKLGLPELDGIGHQFIMPCSIGEIRDKEYHVVFEMSTDEAEALVTEVFGK